jgi:hypothetical protein
MAKSIKRKRRMTCSALAQQIERMSPNAAARDVARACLLIANSQERLGPLRDQRTLRKAWRCARLKEKIALDQLIAVSDELNELFASDAASFGADGIRTLFRAIKVQHQILRMYVRRGVCDG